MDRFNNPFDERSMSADLESFRDNLKRQRDAIKQNIMADTLTATQQSTPRARAPFVCLFFNPVFLCFAVMFIYFPCRACVFCFAVFLSAHKAQDDQRSMQEIKLNNYASTLDHNFHDSGMVQASRFVPIQDNFDFKQGDDKFGGDLLPSVSEKVCVHLT